MSKATGPLKTTQIRALLAAALAIACLFWFGAGSGTPGCVGAGATLASGAYLVDIDGHWAAQDIAELAARGIVRPKVGAEFRPDDAITRAEFCGFIARALSLPELDYAAVFADVPPELPEAAAIEAVSRADIVNGVSTGRFNPQGPLTREQMAAIFLRAYRRLTVDHPAKLAGLTFKDKGSISSWATEAVRFVSGEGIVQGREDGTLFCPGDRTTRAEAAVMIRRFLEEFPEIGPGPWTADWRPAVAGPVYSLAVAPSDPLTVYAGTGGWGGLMKSTDGGRTWAAMPLSPSPGTARGAVRAIYVDPLDPAVVMITSDAARGWAPGVFQSLDGGSTWLRIGLFTKEVKARGLAVIPSPSLRGLVSGYGAIYTLCEGNIVGRKEIAGVGCSYSEWVDAAVGRSPRPCFGAIAVNAVDPRIVLAAAYYDGPAPPVYHAVYVSTDGGSSWGAFSNDLTNLQVETGPYWRALLQPPGLPGQVVIGGDLYDLGTRAYLRPFVDESTIPGTGNYLPDATGRCLRVIDYALSPASEEGDGGRLFALAEATAYDGRRVAVILRSVDGGRTWRLHEAVLPDGAAKLTDMAVAFGASPSEPDRLFLADEGLPVSPSEPGLNLIGRVYRATATGDGPYRFDLVYTNRKPGSL